MFGFSKGLTRLLQGTYLEIITAYEKVDLITDESKESRNNDLAEFSKLYADCVKIAQRAENLDQTCVVGCQSLKSNVEAEYRQGSTQQILDRGSEFDKVRFSVPLSSRSCFPSSGSPPLMTSANFCTNPPLPHLNPSRFPSLRSPPLWRALVGLKNFFNYKRS